MQFEIVRFKRSAHCAALQILQKAARQQKQSGRMCRGRRRRHLRGSKKCYCIHGSGNFESTSMFSKYQKIYFSLKNLTQRWVGGGRKFAALCSDWEAPVGAVGGVGGPAESSRAAPASKLKLTRVFFLGLGSQTQFKSVRLFRRRDGSHSFSSFPRTRRLGWFGQS